MKLLGLVFLLFTSVLASVEKAPEETVVVLSTKNFGDTLKDHHYVLVYFHSDSTKSEDFLFDNTVDDDDDFDVAAEEAKELLPGIKFGKLNTTDQKGYTAMFNITELPAILLFTKGKTTPIEYDGDKTTSDILDWLTEKVDNNIPKLKTVEELKTLIKNHTHLSLFLGSPLSDGYANFVAASTSFLNNIGFAISDEASIREEVDADEETLVVYRNHSEEISHIHGPFTIQRITTFIDSHMHPAIFGFNAISKKRIFDENRDAIFFLGNEADISGPALESFRLISAQFRDKLVFTASTTKDSYGSALAEYLGVSEADLPVVTILHSTGKMLKYRLDQDLTFRNLGMFLLNFYYNNLIPYYKSSLPPFDEYEGDIRIVVSKTFKEIVLDEDKDVLIEFYSPKCKRCQAFAPIYDSIATHLTDIPNLIVAKIDGAANDVEGVELSGFPSIRYYPRGKKQSPLTYSGDLTEEAMIDFIHNQISGEVKNCNS